MKKNAKLRDLNITGLFTLINKKINEKKIMLKGEQNNVTLTLLDNIKTNPDKDIRINLPKNEKYLASEYQNIISNVIMNLRQENMTMRNEINEIKNILGLPNNSRRPVAEVKKLNNPQTNQLNSITLNQSQKLVQKSQNQLNNALRNIPQPIVRQVPNVNERKMPPTNKSFLSSPLGPNGNILKNINNLDIDALSKLEYKDYPKVETSSNHFNRIVAYGVNSYNGIFKNTNEDKIKVILDYKLNKSIKAANGNIINPKISYFGIYDGHGGSKCSTFLQERLDSLLFNSTNFPLLPLQAIYEAFIKSEEEFNSISLDIQKGLMLDKSGSCALSTLFVDEWCYITYLGDSRAIYSFDSGNQLFQITRDHKPNDLVERSRIEKAGGKIYKDTRLKINGQKVHVKEADAPGVNFPFRIIPGNLSVSYIIYNFFRLPDQLEILVLKILYSVD